MIVYLDINSDEKRENNSQWSCLARNNTTHYRHCLKRRIMEDNGG